MYRAIKSRSWHDDCLRSADVHCTGSIRTDETQLEDGERRVSLMQYVASISYGKGSLAMRGRFDVDGSGYEGCPMENMK